MTNKQDIWNELVRQVEKDIILADSGNHGLDCPDYDMEQLKELLACEDVISLNQKVAEAGEGVITRMFSHLRSNLFDWLPIEKTERVLFIGADAGCFANSAAEKAKEVICLNPDFSDAVVAAHRVKKAGNVKMIYGTLENVGKYFEEKVFKYIIFSEPLVLNKMQKIEQSSFVKDVFEAKKYLDPDGNIVFASNNSLGMKYWSGCKDEITDGYFGGLEDYAGTGKKGLPDRADIDKLAEACNFPHHLVYYPYPDYWFPTSIYSDEYMPQEGELTKNAFSWEERMVLFNEVNVWNNILKNGLFSSFSNAFLIVMSERDILSQGINMFTKYSNDRNGRFSIRTDIFIGEDGQRHVRKAGLTDEGKKHLAKMLHWKEELESIYENTNLAINQISETPQGFEFEYLTGKPLLDTLTMHLENDDFNAFYQEFCRLTDILKERNQEEFVMTEEFTNVFGDLKLPCGLKCGRISNIDLIVQNVLLTGQRLNMIDYEWVFDFPVPLNFIIYRSIVFFFKGPRGTYNFNQLYQSQLLEKMGIDAEQCALYEIMEANFQEYICGSHVLLRKIGVRRPQRILPMSPQIYLNFGKGYKRQNSYYASQQLDGKGVVELKIGVTPNMSGVRIDPANVPCIVRILELECGGKEKYVPDYQINGIKAGQNIILYNTIDSQIHINKLEKGTTYVYVKLEITELSQEAAEALAKKGKG